MQKTLFLLLLFIPSILLAQHAGGTFSGSDYKLMGETEIVMKDGSKIKCNDDIDGVKIGKMDIDYRDVDYIHLVKTKLSGHSSYNGRNFKYVIVGKSNKPKLMLVVKETPKLSFYTERPKMKGGSYNSVGVFVSSYTTHKAFMIKNGEPAVEIKFGKDCKDLHKYFPDCPSILALKKDKKKRKKLTYEDICELYKKCEVINE